MYKELLLMIRAALKEEDNPNFFEETAIRIRPASQMTDQKMSVVLRLAGAKVMVSETLTIVYIVVEGL